MAVAARHNWESQKFRNKIVRLAALYVVLIVNYTLRLELGFFLLAGFRRN